MYTPNPIDTSKIVLDEELLELTEKIAENVHEVWAVGRTVRYAMIRLRLHPALCLTASFQMKKRNMTEKPRLKR